MYIHSCYEDITQTLKLLGFYYSKLFSKDKAKIFQTLCNFLLSNINTVQFCRNV